MPELSLATPIATVVVGSTMILPRYSGRDGNVVVGVKTVKQTTAQISSLNKTTSCSEVECRVLKEPCCYKNIVFGNSTNAGPVLTSTYENDLTSYLFNNYTPTNPSITMTLQSWNGSAWILAGNLNDSTYGLYLPLGSISSQRTYYGYIINWGKVLFLLGEGTYRFKLQSFNNGVSICEVGEQFDLYAWNCNQAHGTVKFETYTSGKIGDYRQDYVIHDYTGMIWYNSLRVNGFFGYEKIGEYKTVNLEWGNPYHGKIQKVRDEAIQSFEFHMRQDTPQWVHTGLMVDGMMADTLLVSDYNINNSDYNIKQMGVVRDSGWEPTYFNDKGRRIAGVKVNFKRAVQGVIKTNC